MCVCVCVCVCTLDGYKRKKKKEKTDVRWSIDEGVTIANHTAGASDTQDKNSSTPDEGSMSSQPTNPSKQEKRKTALVTAATFGFPGVTDKSPKSTSNAQALADINKSEPSPEVVKIISPFSW